MFPSCAGHWQEYRADKTAALCRRSYAEGGVLLMQTNLQLDSILRYFCDTHDCVSIFVNYIQCTVHVTGSFSVGRSTIGN